MFYRAKYCAECASELPDYGESFWQRSGFCEVCKPNFKKVELVSRFGGIAVAAVATVFGIGTLLQKPQEAPLNVTKVEIASVASVQKPAQKVENNQPNSAAQPKKVEASQPVALSSKQAETQTLKQLPQQPFDKKVQQNVQEVQQTFVQEIVYACGAKTKKGSPCSRKVKGNVRCWQHLGQEAMLPAKDLRIQ
jgi:hypothetical protein